MQNPSFRERSTWSSFPWLKCLGINNFIMSLDESWVMTACSSSWEIGMDNGVHHEPLARICHQGFANTTTFHLAETFLRDKQHFQDLFLHGEMSACLSQSSQASLWTQNCNPCLAAAGVRQFWCWIKAFILNKHIWNLTTVIANTKKWYSDHFYWTLFFHHIQAWINSCHLIIISIGFFLIFSFLVRF